MVKSNKTGLGRSLESLIPTDFDTTLLTEESERIINVFIKDITPNPEQPRKSFDRQSLDELASSIDRHGIIQPLVVSPKNDKYILVAGERRWRAAQISGLEKVPVIVRDRKELEQLEIALIENVQRVDLTPLEQAVSIEKLHHQFSFSYQQIAKRLGKAHSTVHNIVRLIQLPEKARQALANNQITEGHARSILALKGNIEKQEELLERIIKNQWTVRQAEQFVTSVKQGSETRKAVSRTKAETDETKKLGKKLNTKITIKRTAKGGRLEIHYQSEKELNNLFDLFDKL